MDIDLTELENIDNFCMLANSSAIAYGIDIQLSTVFIRVKK